MLAVYKPFFMISNKSLALSLLLLLFPLGLFAQQDLLESRSSQKLTSFSKWLENPYPIVSAHRGGSYSTFPENALETFDHIASQIPTIIECDVAMTKDSVLILMHDQSLERTTTGMAKVTAIPYDSLKHLRLIDINGDTTSFKIPLLSEALAWGKDKALFTLDIKRGVPFEKVIQMVEDYNAEEYAALITYSFRDAEHIHRLNSELYLSVSIRDQEALEIYRNSSLAKDKLLAFVGTREPETIHYQALKNMGIPSILGTLGNLDRSAISRGDDSVYLKYVQNGALIIATDRPLEVAKVLYKE